MTKSYKDWLDLDVEEIEPMNVSDAKKREIKRNILMKSPKKKKSTSLWRLMTAAVIGISAVATISFTFPTAASNIPFMQNIISYFNEKDTIHEQYDQFATDIEQVETSNGTSVMIENAVFDGTSLTVSYAVETDFDLGDTPHMANWFDIKGASAMGGSGSLQKVGDTTYAGIETITPHFDEANPNQIEVDWQPEAFINLSTNAEIKGNWQFKFKLSKLDGQVQLVNQSVSDHGVTVAIKQLKKNDMTTVIHYEQFVEEEVLKKWSHVSVVFDTVQDNLGNDYIVTHNGGVSHDNLLSFQGSGTIKSIDPNAKSLTIVPTIIFSLGSGKGVEEKKMEPIKIDLQ